VDNLEKRIVSPASKWKHHFKEGNQTLKVFFFQRTVPMRHKEVHAINAHPSLKFALDFGMSLISDKIKSRIKIYTSLEDAINSKMDTSMLPKEYGGTIPMKEMIGKSILITCIRLLLSARQHDKLDSLSAIPTTSSM
jgi:hypothetical protein